MKKSKIIIPAVAGLILSVGAAASGTVAWFSANKSVDADVNNVAIINPEGSLSVKCVGGKNTTASDDKTAIGLTDGWSLRDASCQISGTTLTVWKASTWTEGVVTGTSTVADPYQYDTGTKVAYVALWTMEFELDGAETDKYGIYFDIPNSTLTPDSSSEYASKNIYNAYRIAIYTSSTFVLWAPNASCENNKVKYTNNEGAGTAEYTRATTATKVGELYTSSSGSTPTTLTVNCAMWFDGNEASCDSGSLPAGESQSAECNLAFYASK